MNDSPPLPPASGRSMTDREAETAQFMALLQNGFPKSAVFLELARTPLKYLALSTPLIAAIWFGAPAEVIRLLTKLGWG
ncbi:hypothetical protein GGR90_003076 [Sphingopyxis italica]|uniref:Uncharacterized protein n=1 Tax=Sphingopyxis italica TaxID=1129133 RepID=A0A7X6BA04_9SPHN|nr:hypothetical protein [Sphingopyxis italica]NJB90874.1 hypothetical protein [Sphingopyxis italica]